MAQVEKPIDTSRLGYIRKKLGKSLPTGWELTTLGEALKWGSGGTPKRTEPRYYGGAIPWLIIGDLNDGVVLDSETRITEDGLRNSSAKWVEPGSVLLAMYGSIGKLGIAGKRLTTNQAIAFTKSDPVDAKYLLYFLMFTRGDLASLGKGATQKNISQTVIKVFPFVLAPLTQQSCIVAEIEKQFSRLDEAVANLKRIKANLKRYKAAVLKAAVEGKLTAGWRKQHPNVEPASKLLERILAMRRAEWSGKWKYRELPIPDTTILPRLPQTWTWSSVETICSDVVDCPHSTPKWQATGCVCLRTTEFRPGRLDLSDVRYVSLATYEARIQRLTPRENDIVYSREGGILGLACMIPARLNPCLGQRMMLLRSHALFSPNLLMYWLNSPDLLARVRSLTGGSASPHLNVGEVKSFPVPVAPIAEQNAIVAEVERRLSVIEELEATTEANLTRADRLRQSILGQAFSGKLLLNEARG
jgi:type I restriction enzyme, S subunit